MNRSVFFGITAFLAITQSFAVMAMDAREQAAKETAQALLKRLGGAMQAKLKEGGPVVAIKVCTELSPQYAGDVSRSKGWKVTRVGTRVRNPMLGMPDVWEQKVLADFQKRLDKGEPLESMSFGEVVAEPNGKYYRFMKAIGVRQGCLLCHGAESDIPDNVKALLHERYPKDRATGYKVGDLRGAVSIKQPLE